VLAFCQHFDDLAHDAVAPLDRLIRVGVAAERDGTAAISRLRQFGAQALGGVGLGEQFGFKIETRRQTDVGMTRPSVAVNTSMLASPIRIDGLVERNVGRIVVRDDRAALLDTHRGPERRDLLFGSPAIVVRITIQPLEPALGIRNGAAALGGPIPGCAAGVHPGARRGQ
jgi:hypothetical protein